MQYLQPLSLSYSAWGCFFYLPGSSPLWSHRHSSYPQQIMELAGLIIGLGSCCAACTLGQLCAESSLCSLSLNYSKRCSAVSCAQQQVEALLAHSPHCTHTLSVDENQHDNHVCVCVQEVPLNNERQPDLQTGVIACCSAIHQSVERNSVRYFEELRRHNYVRTSSLVRLMMASFVLSPSCCPSLVCYFAKQHMLRHAQAFIWSESCLLTTLMSL